MLTCLHALTAIDVEHHSFGFTKSLFGIRLNCEMLTMIFILFYTIRKYNFHGGKYFHLIAFNQISGFYNVIGHNKRKGMFSKIVIKNRGSSEHFRIVF